MFNIFIQYNSSASCELVSTTFKLPVPPNRCPHPFSCTSWLFALFSPTVMHCYKIFPSSHTSHDFQHQALFSLFHASKQETFVKQELLKAKSHALRTSFLHPKLDGHTLSTNQLKSSEHNWPTLHFRSLFVVLAQLHCDKNQNLPHDQQKVIWNATRVVYARNPSILKWRMNVWTCIQGKWSHLFNLCLNK